MEKLILEIERQIQRLQAAKQLLLDTQESPHLTDDLHDSPVLPPVKRGRGRPRKHPLPAAKAAPVKAESQSPTSTSASA